MNEQIKALRDEADRLEYEDKLRFAFEELGRISSIEFEVRETFGFPGWLGLIGLYEAVGKARREIAVKLGHNDRVELLVSAGMDRERAEIGDLTTDDEAAECFATWLFDCYGRYNSSMEYAGLKPTQKAFPLGVQFWEEGKHDT